MLEKELDGEGGEKNKKGSWNKNTNSENRKKMREEI
jgi:hypothetical protein